MADQSDLDKRGETLLAELHKLKHDARKKAPKWAHDLLDLLWGLLT